MKKYLLIILIASSAAVFAQKKTLLTKFTSNKMVIDGKLDEADWQTAAIATDFVGSSPINGEPIPNDKKTDVKVLYNNDAIFISALLRDAEPDKILRELAKRDDIGTSDFFGVFINGNNDGQQDYRFTVTASDGQADNLFTDNNGEDSSWDAVWESKALITDIGWVVEMKIPYSALRFSNANKQTWGINFFRSIRRDRQGYTWNLVDAKINSKTQQIGLLEGIENIKTATRFFLLPYSSFYVNADAQSKTKGTMKGGLDIKYGINDAFTLDAILIPDFGQTKFDEKILNLGPFEQQFNENRAFFTEGTDLFSKGNLFYSRRIGGSPSLRKGRLENTLDANEKITNYPTVVGLLNATKISGRTKSGLGIGFLNAVTEKTFATIQDTISGKTRDEVIEPLANFNVLVLDQRFHKNSSVTFINTNVTRNGNFRDENVSGLLWDLNTTENTYKLTGEAKFSYLNNNQNIIRRGFSNTLYFEKTAGKYRYSAGGDYLSKYYNINDLGFLNQVNYYSANAGASYRILNPNKWVNTFGSYFNFYSEFQNQTGKPQSFNLNFNANFQNKKNHFVNFGMNVNPIKVYNYYEPRIEDRFVILPEGMGGWFYLSTNFNNKFAFDFNPNIYAFNEKSRTSYGISFVPRYRFNNRFSLIYSFNYSRDNNDRGFADFQDTDGLSTTANDIIFGNRTVIGYSNALTGKYSITSKMNFDLSVRHYWSYSQVNNYLLLQENGNLTDYVNPLLNNNVDQKAWNFDLSYNWWFAPGSQIIMLYRNSAEDYQNVINKNYAQNITNLLNNNFLYHTFSISVRYFIDFNQAKNWF